MATAFVGRQIVDTITKFEKLEASLRTVTGSAEKAGIAFGFIQEFAATTPFQLEEVTDAFIKLKALGLTPSEDALRSYADVCRLAGVTTTTDLYSSLEDEDLDLMERVTADPDFGLRIVPAIAATGKQPEELAKRALALKARSAPSSVPE